MTAVLETRPLAAPSPPRHRSLLPLAALLLLVAGLAASLVLAAPGMASFADAAPRVSGAPYVTVPEYGQRGGYVLGYEHGAQVALTLPLHNTSRLPLTVTSVSLPAGVAPLLAVTGVRGLPLTLGPGSSGAVTLDARLTNCRYYHERAMQTYDGVTVGYRSLWRAGERTVAFDRPIYLKGPMLVGCPGRKLDRSAENRSDLL
ncbi:MAG: hypothetical protein LC789_10280 [Actinobacteria bacterium]|nr:hypothetical protein [Actinomycetota bacterium]MCA1721112.1 hypothetical protein [Actinomycetota bacterium]